MKRILLALAFLLPGMAIAQSKPNIIFILSDDHAYQAISAYGNRLVQTPNIDRIAHGGALLTNNLVANSICGPSRATLLTGKYSHKNGYTLNEKTFDVHQETFPVLLQQNGYQTAWIGKLHLGSLPIGFNYFNILPGQGHYYNPDFINNNNDTIRYKGYVTNLISDFFFNWLQGRDTSKPFFAVIGEKATHREWLPDIQDLGAYDGINFPLPSTFFDTYDTREAAKDQDMTIDKTMRLAEDLKVHQPFGLQHYEQDKPRLQQWLQKNYPGRNFSETELKEFYVRQGEYHRLDETQQQAFNHYYRDKVSKDFDEKKLSGKELVKWKFQRYLKDYYATAKSLDRNIGKILDYLDSTGLSKNTIVIYASDQGFYLGEHGWFDKRFIYNESLKTAFAIRYPGVIKPGTKLDALVSNTDWAPTILDIAGAKIPSEIQGRSFLPLLKHQPIKDWRKAAYYHYYEYPEPHHVSPHFGLRTKDYMLVRFYKGVNSWELFDLKKDPNQLKNVYNNPSYVAVKQQLLQQLKALILEYDDQEALEIYNHHL
ncbi:arylsulfatase A-like enzyme [Chitinophaga polysaccharea]|uniref:Arylsulfatase A-like enzyme n=1 Tax=Chitinophaga polysaccharea TaxID=1293035 RepID=A0A561PRM3_9BACT|nr:sulfatase [Chitinophaga polysaccharea]TWF40772.1 arylsulfatase A-like enzyme [Chitinophaga polysaccharea]